MTDPQSIPPTSFAILVSMLGSQAMASMGIISVPGAESTEQNLPLAKHFIELLTVLEEKTAGNLDEEESTMLQQILHQLRTMYLEVEPEETP